MKFSLTTILTLYALTSFTQLVKDQDASDKLPEADKRIYDICEEGPETYWDILGPGCSWQEQHFKLEQPLGYGDRNKATICQTRMDPAI